MATCTGWIPLAADVSRPLSSVFCEIEDAIELGVALAASLDSAAHKLSMRL